MQATSNVYIYIYVCVCIPVYTDETMLTKMKKMGFRKL